MAKRNKNGGADSVPPTFDLAEMVIEDINKKFKNDSIASYLHDPNAATHVKNWIRTGCDILDLAVSNRDGGGLPEGKIIEIFGDTGAGKSALAVSILAQTQKAGGLAVLIDTESAATEEFFAAIGLDSSKLIYIQLDALEDVYAAIETIIERYRKAQKDAPLTIVIDSIMGASTKNELESTYDRQGWATTKALINSMAMRKITNLIARERITLIGVNQIRANMNAGFGAEQWVTSGGKAWAFHASVRIRLKNMGQIEGKIDTGQKILVGRKVRAQIVKNRVGPPLRHADYDFYFQYGIDNYGSWLSFLKEYEIIGQAGAWYNFGFVDENTGEEKNIKFQSKDFERLLTEDREMKDVLYKKICESFVMHYKNSEAPDIHDIVLDDEVSTEE
jgi:recombination protein RecA